MQINNQGSIAFHFTSSHVLGAPNTKQNHNGRLVLEIAMISIHLKYNLIMRSLSKRIERHISQTIVDDKLNGVGPVDNRPSTD